MGHTAQPQPAPSPPPTADAQSPTAGAGASGGGGSHGPGDGRRDSFGPVPPDAPARAESAASSRTESWSPLSRTTSSASHGSSAPRLSKTSSARAPRVERPRPQPERLASRCAACFTSSLLCGDLYNKQDAPRQRASVRPPADDVSQTPCRSAGGLGSDEARCGACVPQAQALEWAVGATPIRWRLRLHEQLLHFLDERLEIDGDGDGDGEGDGGNGSAHVGAGGQDGSPRRSMSAAQRKMVSIIVPFYFVPGVTQSDVLRMTERHLASPTRPGSAPVRVLRIPSHARTSNPTLLSARTA